MLGLTTQQPKKQPTLGPPDLRPRKRRIDKRVFLEPTLWDRLAETAKFHWDVFKAMGVEERVSRNDIIEAFLEWADNAYWDDKGGRPTSKEDRAEKVKRHAAKLGREADADKLA